MGTMLTPPGHLTDLETIQDGDQLKDFWSFVVGGQFEWPYRPPVFSFLPPHEIATSKGAIPVTITWNAFPRRIKVFYTENRSDLSLAERRARMFADAEKLEPFILEHRTRKDENTSLGPRRYDPARVRPMLFEDDQGKFSPGYLLNRQQDEYLEWHVDRKAGRAKRMTFSCETLDYFQVLFDIPRQIRAMNGAQELVPGLYQKHVSKHIGEQDIKWGKNVHVPIYEYFRDKPPKFHMYERLRKQQSDRYNSWNPHSIEQSIMHMSRIANTLQAEVSLAGRAATRYRARPDIKSAASVFDLMSAANLGDINRNSDAAIVAAVNNLALSNFAITIADPVGVYIAEINVEGLRAPDGTPIHDVGQALKIIRPGPARNGFPPMILRFEISPPPGADYDLEACTLDGQPLRYGGQIAERVTMAIYGMAMPFITTPKAKTSEYTAHPHPDHPGLWAQVSNTVGAADISDAGWDIVTHFRKAEPDIPSIDQLVKTFPELSEFFIVSEDRYLYPKSPQVKAILGTKEDIKVFNDPHDPLLSIPPELF